jgi:serine/threonine protein kinase, bacterial
VSLLNTRTGALLRTIPLGLMPCDAGADLPCTAAAVDERTRRVFVVGDSGPGTFTGGVRMLDARSGAVLRRLTVRGRPYAVAVDARRGHVFVVNLGDPTINGTVLMLDARTGGVLHTLPVGGTPLALAVDERTGRAIVLGTNGGARALLNRSGLSREFATDTLSVLDTRTGAILRTITVGGDLRAVVVDARTNHAFVADYAGGSVSMINLAR